MLEIICSSITRASKPTGAAVDGCVRAFSESPDTRTTKSVSNTKATEQRSDEKIMKQWSLNKYERCTSLLLQRNIISLQMLRSTVEELRRAVAIKLRLVAANSCQLLHSITNARRMDETLSGWVCASWSVAELCRWSPFSSQHLTSYRTYIWCRPVVTIDMANYYCLAFRLVAIAGYKRV